MTDFETGFKANVSVEQWQDIKLDIDTEKVDENGTYEKLAKIIGLNEQDITTIIADKREWVIYFNVVKGTLVELSDVIMEKTPEEN